MNAANAIASDLSYLVLQKQLAERNGRDVPKVKAPAEKPSRFERDERLHGINPMKASR